MAQKAGATDRRRGSEPTLRVRETLNAYVDNGLNAAATARQLRVDEKTVRRHAEQYPAYVAERCRINREERRQADREREERLERQLDDMLRRVLERLDRFADGEDPGVALRAIRMQIDLILRLPSRPNFGVISQMDVLDDVVTALARGGDVDESASAERGR